MKIVIVVPTYNERENISKFIDMVVSQRNDLRNHELAILVVDGNSPDGTGDAVSMKAREYEGVILLSEKKKSSIGGAYTYGMEHALKNLSADAVVEMDADFQHDPKDVKRLIAKLESGFDYVLGSRYVKGGSIPATWAFYRKFLSYFGNLFSRVVLNLLEIHDITSGYRISRATYLSKIDLHSLPKAAYTYKIQLLYEMKKAGAKISEIPIQFGLRDRGDSKMEKENILSSLRLVVGIRYKESESFFKFLVVGLIGLIVQTLLFFSEVLALNIEPKTALLPAFVVAVFTTFTLNNIWSFKNQQITEFNAKIKKFFVFVLINVGSFFIQRTSLYLSQILTNNSKFIVLLVGYPAGIGVGLVWNYLFYSKIVWKKPKV